MSSQVVLDYFKLIPSILDALAWPTAVALAVYWFRAPIREILNALPSTLNRLRNVKIANIEAELSQQSAAASSSAAEPEKGIPLEQIEAAVRVKTDAVDVGLRAIRAQAMKLAQEYETTRSLMPSSDKRTVRMNQTMAKMRTIALAAEPLLSEFATQDQSSGERLMAIAILQMKPQRNWLQWLAERMRKEVPFVFYHASVALFRAAEHLGAECPDELRLAIRKAEDTLRAFKGKPDTNTLKVLERAALELAKRENEIKALQS